jgi:hypothetical protein
VAGREWQLFGRQLRSANDRVWIVLFGAERLASTVQRVMMTLSGRHDRQLLGTQLKYSLPELIG